MRSSYAYCLTRFFLFKTNVIIRVITCSKDGEHVIFSLSAPRWYHEGYRCIKYHYIEF